MAFGTAGPPSSPPYTARRTIRTAHVTAARMQNVVTEKASAPGSTSNSVPRKKCTMAASDQAMPMPRNTLTAFDPVTLPIDESAYWSFTAATLDANVSGSDVPSATKVIAVTASFSPMLHPK